MKMIQPIIIISLLALLTVKQSCGDYWADRNAILENEAFGVVGSLLFLNEKEQQINEQLMNWKRKEFDDGLENPSTFLASQHFFKAKAGIEQSEIFKFIQGLPKGASLHSHSSAMVSIEWLMNQTYRDDLYLCKEEESLQLRFFFNNQTDSTCSWQLLSEVRAEDAQFDDYLLEMMTLFVDDVEAAYPDINAVWKAFNRCFSVVGGFLYYKPVYEAYVRQVIQEFYDDNIMYIEIRGSLGTVFDEDGNQHDLFDIYQEAIAEFQQTHPDFLGIRMIYSKSRNNDNETVAAYVNQALEMQNLYPDFVVGFDLVGQEDKGKPLVEFVDIFLDVANLTTFFFHAGETNWNGATTDQNLIDAVLLNTSRIGHAFAILKHSEVLKLVRDRDIAIEINPISNQVLKLVRDMRNHPGTYLIGNNYAVVITCDDPTFWGAKGVSYDWYMAFMGMTSRDTDLKVLKQLAINSIVYSSMDDNAKLNALIKWDKKWNEYIDKLLEVKYP